MHLNLAGVMLWLRVTSRISGILLAGSFSSLALRRLWPSPFTQWMATSRHRFTLLFALSHTLHLGGVMALATLTPEQFLAKKGLVVVFFGAAGYALIYSAAWMAFKRRKTPDLPDAEFQTFGMYVLWAVFTLAFTSGLLRNPGIYARLALVMWLALAARVRAKLASDRLERVALLEEQTQR